jgi:hypothetical protein
MRRIAVNGNPSISAAAWRRVTRDVSIVATKLRRIDISLQIMRTQSQTSDRRSKAHGHRDLGGSSRISRVHLDNCLVHCSKQLNAFFVDNQFVRMPYSPQSAAVRRSDFSPARVLKHSLEKSHFGDPDRESFHRSTESNYKVSFVPCPTR